HVVVAGLVPVVAGLVAHVGVAGEVPAVLHVHRLALVGQVAAAGGAAHGQSADLPVLDRLTGVGEHARLVPGDRLAGRAGPDPVVGGRDEDVQHLGGPDAVDDLHAGRLIPGLPG